jgi:hypothetical protein
MQTKAIETVGVQPLDEIFKQYSDSVREGTAKVVIGRQYKASILDRYKRSRDGYAIGRYGNDELLIFRIYRELRACIRYFLQQPRLILSEIDNRRSDRIVLEYKKEEQYLKSLYSPIKLVKDERYLNERKMRRQARKERVNGQA